MPIDFNPQKKKTMLTIDGGGARGIIPLMALHRLEQDTGQICHELFDLVGGTSVGALIAVGSAAGRTAAGYGGFPYPSRLPPLTAREL